MLKTLIGAFGCLTISACAVTPSIQYHSWSERPRKDSWIPYQLTDSTVIVGAVDGAPPTSKPVQNSSVATTSTPEKSDSPASVNGKGKQAGNATRELNEISEKDSVPASDGFKVQTSINQPISSIALRPISLEHVDLACTKAGCGPSGLAVIAVPIPYEGRTLAIEPLTRNFVRSLLTPTYYDRSLRLKALTVKVVDQRKEVVDTFVALATGVAQMAKGGGTRELSLAPQPSVLHLPIVLDLASLRESNGRELPLPGNEELWTYSFSFLDGDPKEHGFLTVQESSQVHGAILSSLCRPAQLRLKSRSGGVEMALGTTVADPLFLVSVPLPTIGSVGFGELCGVQINETGTLETEASQLVKGFFAGAETLRSSLKVPAKSASGMRVKAP